MFNQFTLSLYLYFGKKYSKNELLVLYLVFSLFLFVLCFLLTIVLKPTVFVFLAGLICEQ